MSCIYYVCLRYRSKESISNHAFQEIPSIADSADFSLVLHPAARKSTLFRREGHLGRQSHLGEMDDNEELDERNEHDVVELKVDVSDTWCRRVKGASRYFF